MDLQQEILSASFMKQRWLFDAIVTKYIECIKNLTKFQISTSQKGDTPQAISIDVFKDTEYSIAQINPKYEYKQILIKSSQIQNALLMHLIKLLTHSMCLLARNKVSFLKSSLDSILHTFDTMNLSIKCLCIQFITKSVRKCIISEDDLVTYLGTVIKRTLKGIFYIIQNLNKWLTEKCISNGDVERFYEVSATFLSCKDIMRYCSECGSSNYSIPINICLCILSVNQPKMNVKFVNSVYLFLAEMLQQSETNEFTETIKFKFHLNNRKHLIPNAMILLEHIILRKLKSDHENQDNILKIIDELADNILCDAASCNSDDQFMGKSLLFLF